MLVLTTREAATFHLSPFTCLLFASVVAVCDILYNKSRPLQQFGTTSSVEFVFERDLFSSNNLLYLLAPLCCVETNVLGYCRSFEQHHVILTLEC
jgi:hypothetical protein